LILKESAMTERHRGLILPVVFVTLMIFQPAVGRSDQALSTARDAILKATQQALAVLLAHNGSGYVAVLHPDFIHIDHTGKPIHQTERAQRQWGFVAPQMFVTDDQRTEQMQLVAVTSTITSISMPSEDEAITTGAELLRWQGKHGEDLRQVNADGSVAVVGNTEVRTVTVTYRRQWVRDSQGTWRLKRSQIASAHITAVL
jgi:hypothetical protein